MNESHVTYEWVMSRMWMTLRAGSWRRLGQMWMSRVTRVNESCDTCEWVMSHVWMCHVTRVNGSHVTHMNDIETWQLKVPWPDPLLRSAPYPTRISAWHDSFTCDTTFVYAWPDSFICVARFVMHHIQLVHVCGMSHAYSFWIYGCDIPHYATRFHTCDIKHYPTPKSEWHVSFICVTWSIHLCDMTHLCVWYDSFICATCLILMCDMTHSDSFIYAT